VGFCSVQVGLSRFQHLLGVVKRFLGPISGNIALAGRFLALEVFCFGMYDALMRVPSRCGCLFCSAGF